jgi:hypothetical protein
VSVAADAMPKLGTGHCCKQSKPQMGCSFQQTTSKVEAVSSYFVLLIARIIHLRNDFIYSTAWIVHKMSTSKKSFGDRLSTCK